MSSDCSSDGCLKIQVLYGTGFGSFVSLENWNWLFFNRTITQVLIYNKALNIEEIKQNFYAVKLKYNLN